MTCIVGIRAGNRVHIGGDSAGVDSGMGMTIRADTKVFHNGPYLMGFTTSFRMGQLLRYADLPAPEGDLDRFMVTTFVDSVRKALRDGGWLTKASEREEGGTFLVGIADRLLTVYSDFQVAESTDGYAAAGCGEEIALGSLHSTRTWASATRRIEAALEAAAHHSGGVAAPFVVERTRPRR